MSVIDLQSHRLAGLMRALSECVDAQAQLDSKRQHRFASQVIAKVGEPRTAAEGAILANAQRYAVDALCNLGETAQARVQAAHVNDLLLDTTPQRLSRVLKVKYPRTLDAFRAGVVLAQAIELDGDPDEAISRCVGLERQLQLHPELGDTRQERLRALRGVLSASKRSGGRHARSFAARARERGDQLAEELARLDPATAFSYLHRAACEERARIAGTAGVDRVISLYERSDALRPATPRHEQTRGMAAGEIRVLRGEVEAGARIMTQTAQSFADVLPRHETSARQQLMERDLLRVA